MNILILPFLLLMALKTFSQTPEERLKQLNIQLPEVSEALGSYVDVVEAGKLLYLSGKGPRKPDGQYIIGKLGEDLTIKQGYDASRLVAINQIAVLKKKIGDLSKIKRIVKVNGYVNSHTKFYDQPKVINGFSDLMIEIFGKCGQHARTAIGSSALPLNMAVEVEMIVEVK